MYLNDTLDYIVFYVASITNRFPFFHFSLSLYCCSGGERSFTTLALLLALGENLETPFRVMDEFDVFLDPVSRKIALQTMINVAKEMEHRQFIFITPQDLSSIQTDSKLKIFQMKNPKRGNVGGAQQQTLAFE